MRKATSRKEHLEVCTLQIRLHYSNLFNDNLLVAEVLVQKNPNINGAILKINYNFLSYVFFYRLALNL